MVLGAAADEARPLLEGYDVEVVVAEDWAEGMGASLRTGLRSLTAARRPLHWSRWSTCPTSAPMSYAALLDRPVSADTLARATYDGTPGHPVLIGRDHWAGVIESATGDQGARAYLGRARGRARRVRGPGLRA